MTLAWIDAQIEDTLRGANSAKNVYDLAMLTIARQAIAARPSEEPAQESGYSSAAAPADPPAIRTADPVYGQAPYTHGVGSILPREAQIWVESMVNADGTRGGRWTIDDVCSLAQKRGFSTQMEQVEFWAVMCMMAADYGEVMKHYGMNSPELYADLARAWMNDPDAVEDKTREYLLHVVQ